jgi:hypothetical protein
MSSEQPRRRESSGSAGSPAGSTAAIIIAIVAVVVGFLIIREIRDDDGDSTIAPVDTEAPIDTGVLPIDTIPLATELTTTSTTIFTPVTEGATIVVANASTVNGAAGILTTALSGAGFTMGEPTNASAKQDATTVLYDPTDPEGAAVAQSVAILMGNATVAELTTPAPIDGGVLADGVTVLVMLGSDKANLTLDAMGTATTTIPTTIPGTPTTVAPA